MKKAFLVAVGLAYVFIGCKKSPPAKPVSFGIFEVIDCSTSRSAPILLKGSNEKYCIAANPVVTERDIGAAAANHNDLDQPILNMYFHHSGADRLRETTQRLTNQPNPGRMAILIDGRLIMAPVVKGIIADSVVIAGGFRDEEAKDLAESLNASRQ